MQLTMYQASVVPILQMLGNLEAILDKAAAHCDGRKIKAEVFPQARLFPDMLPLSSQIQIASDMAKGCVARLSGVEAPKYEDYESTLPELKQRLAKTVEFIKSVKPEQIDGSEDKQINLKTGGQERTFSGKDYLFNFVLPNVYFHATTAYAILRSGGVELGKRDFLGPL